MTRIHLVVAACAFAVATTAFAEDKAKTGSAPGASGSTPAATSGTKPSTPAMGTPAAAGAKTGTTTATAGGSMDHAAQKNCGAMMAEKSAMPAKMSEWMTAMAENMEAHAKWIGSKTKPDDKAMLGLVDSAGLTPILRLRAVRAWSKDPKENKQALDDANQLIERATQASSRRLRDPDRLRELISQLKETPEEKTYALRELYKSGAYAMPELIESLGKAGANRWAGRRPKVRGEVMNPVDHPHGGRTRGGRNVVSPWGKKEGVKTRNKKKSSQRLIVRGRKRGKATQ
jgi:hypothetical protein